MRLSLLVASVLCSGLPCGTAEVPPYQLLRNCESCVAVKGYGWCPIARRCSPGYPGKAGSCRGDETDFSRAAAFAADAGLKDALQEQDRAFSMAVLFHNVGGLAGEDNGFADQWELAAQGLDEERDVRLYTLDCAAHSGTCEALLPPDEANQADNGFLPRFFAAGKNAGNWRCPADEETCERAFPKARQLGSIADKPIAEITTQDLKRAVREEVSFQRGFPLPKLEEVAADFVRAAVMRSGNVDDSLELALFEHAKKLAAEEYNHTAQHAAAAAHFIDIMEAVLAQPAGRDGRRMSILSRTGNLAASAAKGNHHSLEHYVDTKARHYAAQSMTNPLLGK